MKKASEYREHAGECRKLAAGMQGEKREQTLALAGLWEKLAVDRERRDRCRVCRDAGGPLDCVDYVDPVAGR